MVHLTEVASGFLLLSGVVSLALAVVSFVAYRRSRHSALAFVIAAFLVFTAKSFLVGYSIYSGFIEHETLEFLDAVGDMATVLLFALPLLAPRGRQAQ